MICQMHNFYVPLTRKHTAKLNHTMSLSYYLDFILHGLKVILDYLNVDLDTLVKT